MTASINTLGSSIQKAEAKRKLAEIGSVILIGSGKGGVGKSLVSCAIALSLSKKRFRTAILDIDIHGASLPIYFELATPLRSTKKGLEPKVVDQGLKAMSLALFTGSIPIPVRGAEKESLIIDLFALTHWGTLDYLVVDLPPGLGDEVLSAFSLFHEKASLILVTTPSPSATEIVSRLRQLADTEAIQVKGIVVNMAYSHYHSRKLYPFGKAKMGELESGLRSRVIGEIPLDSRVSTQSLMRVLNKRGALSKSVEELVERIVG
jgi:ATP-binding protein involved in chromosome partitioning